MPRELRVRLQPKQTELWRLWDESNITRIGSGGARGGSKSGGGRRCILLRRLKYPKTTGLILRRTYPELYKSHLIKLFEEFPQTKSWYNAQNKEMIFPNGSRLFFGSAEHPGDMSAFYSAEFADVLVDEAQEFSQGELERLTGSNRCTSNYDITPKMVYTFMPGMSESGLPPMGLPYLKRIFADGQILGDEGNEKWQFLQAFSWDNIEWARKELTRDGIGRGNHNPDASPCPHCVDQEEQFYAWPEDQRREYYITRTEFGRKLAALTNKYLRDAWLYGKWDAFEGQYFVNFSAAKHVISEADVRARAKPWHKRWLAGDWGFDHPHCILWFVEDEKGVVIIYREQWGRELGETELGRLIGERSKGEKLIAFPFSWDAFGKLNKKTKKSITWMLNEGLPDGIPRPAPADSSPGSRISGWRLMYQLLDAGKLLISADCPKLLEQIPTLMRNPENTEDVLKVDYSENYIGDDAADAARMGLQNMVSMPVKPIDQVLEEKLAPIADMHQKHMTHLQFIHTQKPKAKSFKLRRR